MFPCGRVAGRPLNRRDFLTRSANGFGAVALSALLADWVPRVQADDDAEPAGSSAFALPGEGPERDLPLHGRRAVAGRHVRSEAAAPARSTASRSSMKMEPTQFNNNGNTLGCPWKFHEYGQSGHAGQRPVPARGPARRRPGGRSAR